MINELQRLFQVYSEQEVAPIIELQNINHQPVGALYLNKFREKGQFTISSTTTGERYYFYCDGVAIFFSYWKKLDSKNC